MICDTCQYKIEDDRMWCLLYYNSSTWITLVTTKLLPYNKCTDYVKEKIK